MGGTLLFQNQSLAAVADELAGRPPNWKAVVERFKEEDIYDYTSGRLASRLSELILQVGLEEICQTLGIDAEINPIKPGDSTSGFEFYDSYGEVMAQSKKTRLNYSGIDLTLLIDHLFVLFEIRLNANARQNKKDITRVMKPIQQYSRERLGNIPCGYVFVACPSHANPSFGRWHDFIEAGGLLVPFYADREKFLEDVFSTIMEYGLHEYFTTYEPHDLNIITSIHKKTGRVNWILPGNID